MNNRPKKERPQGTKTRYAKDDQSKEDKVANSEQISERKGKTHWGQYCLIKASIQRGKEYQYRKLDTDNCKEGITSTG